MARPLRIQYPDAFYHVTSRGNEGRSVFRTQGDRRRFLSYLGSAHERYGAIIHAYCLMNNHYHLLIETPQGNLSQILHHVNGAYTTYFNTKRHRSGHLFQGRYKAILVEKDAYCQELSRYIHLNPVRAGLVDSPAKYSWSSYPFYVGLARRPSWLATEFILSQFGRSSAESRANYRRFVEKGLDMELRNPLEDVVASTFLGSDAFVASAREKLDGMRVADMRDLPALRALASRPTLDQVEEAVASVVGRESPHFRDLCLHVSHEHGGFTLNQIGAHFGMKGPAVSQASRRFGMRMSRDDELKAKMEEVLDRIRRKLNVET